ncbi:MAG TPA: hypothetical protein VLX92_09545 [Kofleriaceae bacterium]|nr:hypothetical protein [Kofleriaceae bacterium]
MFYGFGAVVGNIIGPTVCKFWPDNPASYNWDPSFLVQVELSLTPQAARNGTINPAAIQVDDFSGWGTGGMTRIGPMFPGGTTTGACWLESGYYNKLPNPPPRVPSGVMAQPYELCTMIDWAQQNGRRFYGVFAEIKAVQGNLGLIAMWNPGTSLIPNQQPAGTWWVDVAQVSDPISGGLTTIGLAPGQPKLGALFIDAATFAQHALHGPKLPPWAGHRLEP